MSKRCNIANEEWKYTVHRIQSILSKDIKGGKNLREVKHSSFNYYEEQIYKLLVDIYYKKLILADLEECIKRAIERGDI